MRAATVAGEGGACRQQKCDPGGRDERVYRHGTVSFSWKEDGQGPGRPACLGFRRARS